MTKLLIFRGHKLRIRKLPVWILLFVRGDETEKVNVKENIRRKKMVMALNNRIIYLLYGSVREGWGGLSSAGETGFSKVLNFQ